MEMSYPATLAEVERAHILQTLTFCSGNRTRSAKLLGISIRCLRCKLHDYIEAGVEVAAANNVNAPIDGRITPTGRKRTVFGRG